MYVPKYAHVVEICRLRFSRCGLEISSLEWRCQRVVAELHKHVAGVVVNKVALRVVPVGMLPLTVLIRPIICNHQSPCSDQRAQVVTSWRSCTLWSTRDDADGKDR